MLTRVSAVQSVVIAELRENNLSNMGQQPPRLFRRAKEGRLVIGCAAMTAMWSYRQIQPDDTEAGGVLLGRYIDGTDEIVVDAATTPQRGDRRTHSRFYRGRRTHQELIDAAWNESNGATTYLGEWHTHPESIPAPSIIDRAGWSKKLIFDVFSDALLFVILGTEDLRVWEGERLSCLQTPLMEETA